MADAAPTIGEQMGLGDQWTPTRVSWQWATAASTRGRMNVLILNLQTGRVAVPLSDDDLDRFIARAQLQRGGVTVAGEEALAELEQRSSRVEVGSIAP